MPKTEVYSWRVAAATKAALEDAARARGISLAAMLDEMAVHYLAKTSSASADDRQEQERLHAAARPFIGAIAGGDPDRAAEASRRVREKLRRRHHRATSE
jgi:hypothetical protein